MEETPESNSTSSDGAVEAAPNGVDDGNHSSLPLQQHPEGTAPEDRDDIYSESDVSMEIESDDETKAIPGDPGTLPGSDASNEATSSRQKRRHPDDSGRKRKKARKLAKAEDEGPSNPSSTQQLSDTAALQETPSQPPSSDKLLSPEIWCHVFSFTEPRTLGRLLRVNKLFNSLLDPSSKHLQPITSQSSSAAKPLTADVIWKLSRTRFCGNMPSPLQGRSELDMWRLLLSRNCQFCSKAGSGSHLNLEGSMIMWSFGIRSCASCLSDRTMKVRLECFSCCADDISDI